MRRTFLALIALSSLITACDHTTTPAQAADAPQPADSCMALLAATSAQVLLPPGSAAPHKNAYRLTDREALHRLTAFIRLRSDVEPPDADTRPWPDTKVTFTGGHSIAVFGTGPGRFYFQCGTVKGVRYASAGELAEFEALIAPPAPAQ